MHLIAKRLEMIQQVRDQLTAQQAAQDRATSAAAADTDPLKDAYPNLLEEETQLKAEATLIKTVLADLEKSTKSSGFSGFLTKLFGQGGVKWSPDTQKVFAAAVTQDVSRFLEDKEVFKALEKMLGNDFLNKLTPGPDGSTGYSDELTQFHNHKIANKRLPQLQRLLAQLKPVPENEFEINHLQGAIAELEDQVCTRLGKKLETTNYLKDLGPNIT